MEKTANDQKLARLKNVSMIFLCNQNLMLIQLIILKINCLGYDNLIQKGKIGLHVQTTSWQDMKINLAELI